MKQEIDALAQGLQQSVEAAQQPQPQQQLMSPPQQAMIDPNASVASGQVPVLNPAVANDLVHA